MSDSEEGKFYSEMWGLDKKSKKGKCQEVQGGDKEERKSCKAGATEKEERKKEKKKRKKKKTTKEKKTTDKEQQEVNPEERRGLAGDVEVLAEGGGKREEELAREQDQSSPRKRKDVPTPGSASKAKRRKRVAFELPPGCLRVRRPKIPPPKPAEAVRSERTGPPGPHGGDRESQSGEEDINSQDLFITQKCRGSRTRPCSEVSSSSREEKQSQPTRETDSLLDKWILKSAPFLDEPFVPSTFPSECVPLTPPSRTADASSQTENFFTAVPCSYLRFCREIRPGEVLKPLDLSLPHRARAKAKAGAGTGAVPCSVPETIVIKDDEDELSAAGGAGRLSQSPKVKDEVVHGSFGDDSTPSTSSQTEAKSVETTTSSEDNCFRQREVIQVRSVQMILNKPFFFKTKGDRLLPRPDSPLMMLTHGRAAKLRKRR